ncbi:acyltransferase [bacterium]|nr:MAG: acyltransferase [bacterium]
MKNNAFASGTFLRRVVDFFHFFYLSLLNHVFNRIPIYWIRKLIYKYMYFMKIGDKSNVQMGVRVYAPWKIRIGNNCSIGHDCLLDGRRGIEIGDNVDLAGYVRIFTLGHDLNEEDYRTKGAKVIIRNNASIFTGAYILPGKVIAEGSVIALASVITKDTEPWCIYAGNPAKKVGERTIRKLTYNRNYKRYFH